MSTIPTARVGIFGFFDTGGRFWTPAWDSEHGQPCEVAEVKMGDGHWHRFSRLVSRAEATKFRINGSAPA